MSSSSFASTSSYSPVPLSKQNAAGLSAEQSLVLPQREVSSQDEQTILEALVSIYAPGGQQQQQDKQWMEEIFANDVIYSGPKGEVFLGHAGLIKLQEQSSEARKLQQRLLVTPETLPVGSMVIDQVISEGEGEKTKRSLIVLKRRDVDGKVVQWTEEEGHRRVSIDDDESNSSFSSSIILTIPSLLPSLPLGNGPSSSSSSFSFQLSFSNGSDAKSLYFEAQLG